MSVTNLGNSIDVRGELDLRVAEDLRLAGLAALSRGVGLRISAPDAAYVDAMALQVLLSLRAECTRQQAPWSLDAPGEGVARWLAWSGASALLNGEGA